MPLQEVIFPLLCRRDQLYPSFPRVADSVGHDGRSATLCNLKEKDKAGGNEQ